MASEKRKYSLYIGKYTELPKEVKFDYFSAESGYLLAYHDSPIEGMRLVPAEKEVRLSTEERAWLLKCKLKVNAEAVKENYDETITALSDFLEAFEKELKTETEKKAK